MTTLLKLFLSALFAFPCFASADVIPNGSGIIYGSDHVFALKAPEGWSLDNESAAKGGLHAVFFPSESSWADSEVVAYARARPINAEVATIQDAVDAVVNQFRINGSEGFSAKKSETVKTSSGAKGVIYKFTKDKNGNLEAACYFKEKKTINYIVLSGRNKEALEEAWESFLSLCKSYIFMSDHFNLKIKGDEKANDKLKE